MRLERVTDIGHKMFEEALQVYRISFPFHEQREIHSQINIIQDDGYHFDLIYDEGLFVGLLLFWKTEDFIYIEHFCILPEMRNKQYGRKALELLGRQGKTMILEIDPPVDAISCRRKEFYERSGFVETPYLHVHPPYHRGNTGHSLVLMSYPQKIAQEGYGLFRRYLERRVMADAYI